MDADAGAEGLRRLRRHPHLQGDPALEGATGAANNAGLGGVAPVQDVSAAALRERAARAEGSKGRRLAQVNKMCGTPSEPPECLETLL